MRGRQLCTQGRGGGMPIQAADLAFYSDFALYLRNSGAAADGRHAAIPNLVWWDWNPNSGDTGGIVQDDWLTVSL